MLQNMEIILLERQHRDDKDDPAKDFDKFEDSFQTPNRQVVTMKKPMALKSNKRGQLNNFAICLNSIFLKCSYSKRLSRQHRSGDIIQCYKIFLNQVLYQKQPLTLT